MGKPFSKEDPIPSSAKSKGLDGWADLEGSERQVDTLSWATGEAEAGSGIIYGPDVAGLLPW